MSVNFSELASMKTEDVKKPPLPPQGHYRWQITKLPSERTSADDKWLTITFPVQAVEALDGGMMDGYEGEVSNIRMTKQFMINKLDSVEAERGIYQLRVFLEEHVGSTGETMGELMNGAVNGQFVAPVQWRERSDNGETVADVGRTAPVA